MEFHLDWQHEKFVTITVTSVISMGEMIHLMSEIIQHPDYPVKNTLWDLRGARMGLSITDLREITGVLSLYKPEVKNFADKAALLVPGKLNTAMAEVFVSMTRHAPIRYKVFNDLETARDYVSS